MREAEHQEMQALRSSPNLSNYLIRNLVMRSEVILNDRSIREGYFGEGNVVRRGWRPAELAIFEHPSKLGCIICSDSFIAYIDTVIIIAAGAVICEVHRTCPHSFLVEDDKFVMHKRTIAAVIYYGNTRLLKHLDTLFLDISGFGNHANTDAALMGLQKRFGNYGIIQLVSTNV
jgi:hypothetical protein